MTRPTDPQQEYDRLAAFITSSELPRKQQKLDGLRAAFAKRIPLTLLDDTIFLDGVALDTSELEDGYWL